MIKIRRGNKIYHRTVYSFVPLKIVPVPELEEKTKSKRGEEGEGCEKIIGG